MSLKFFLNVNYIDFKARVEAQPPEVNYMNWKGKLRVEEYLQQELCKSLAKVDSGFTFTPYNNATKAVSSCTGVVFQDTSYGRGPVNDGISVFQHSSCWLILL